MEGWSRQLAVTSSAPTARTPTSDQLFTFIHPFGTITKLLNETGMVTVHFNAFDPVSAPFPASDIKKTTWRNNLLPMT